MPHEDFHHQIKTILDELQQQPADTAHLQQRIDKLAEHYQRDESLGQEVYKLYQAQAMLSYWEGDYDKSRQFINEAIRVHGSRYQLATDLLQHLDAAAPFERKSTARWITLIAGPFVALVVVAILQIIAHFVFTKATGSDGLTTHSTNPVQLVINILSILIGIVAISSLVLIPVWIIKLVQALQYNAGKGQRLSKTAGIIIAVLMGMWYWLYTYDREKTKFWVNFVLCIVTFGYFGIVSWVWAIIESCTRSDAYYQHFPNVER